MKSQTKSHILQTSARLFFEEGLATGIDRITSECETAKMTIYTHFASKDGLICAVLHEVQTALLGNIRSHALHSKLPAQEQLQAAFNIVCHGMSDAEVRAGLVVRALMEFPRANHPVHRAALDLEHVIQVCLEPLCAGAHIADSEEAARHLLLLAKGAYTMSPSVGVEGSRMLAAKLAGAIIGTTALSADSSRQGAQR